MNGTEVNGTTAYFALGWTREQAVTAISFAYVVISILMVLLWSMYLCIDGRRSPRKDTVSVLRKENTVNITESPSSSRPTDTDPVNSLKKPAYMISASLSRVIHINIS